jgi:2-polyprenyl-6-methoxyphenol hydroxylase-like FAD-dependent oxidoreductase
MLILFMFESGRLPGAEPTDDASRKAALRQVFAGQPWETPQILAALDDAPEIYFDRMSQIVMPGWSNGRTILIGDAAGCVSLLAGEGAGLAMAEAYVLAGEIAAASGDVEAAFDRYERKLRPFIEAKQSAARRFAFYFAPRTKFSVWLRNQVVKLMGIPWIGAALVARDVRDDFVLPEPADLAK